jgi:hypothetical protein
MSLNTEMSISQLGLSPRQLTRDEVSMESSCPSLFDCMERIVNERKFTDVKILAGDEEFECHFLVLKSYSRYFEKFGLDSPVIKLPKEHVTSRAFEAIYEWMLNDSETIKRSYFVELFKAAKFLQIDELICQCMCIIDDGKLIGEREALSLYLEAIEHDEQVIKDIMIRKINKIFLTFVASIEFLNLNFNDVQQLLKLNSIGVNSELDIFFTVLLWLEHDWNTRKDKLIPLMELVRFELFQPWQLVELKKCPENLSEALDHDEIFDLIDNALASITLSKSSFSIGDYQRDFVVVLKRRIINDDVLWKSFDFETNPNFHENYLNFCKYLHQISSCHWLNIQKH